MTVAMIYQLFLAAVVAAAAAATVTVLPQAAAARPLTRSPMARALTQPATLGGHVEWEPFPVEWERLEIMEMVVFTPPHLWNFATVPS
jgi:hypothetical protein